VVFSRQVPWFSESGQKQLAMTRFGVVGASGTGSQVITQLGGLGARRFVLVDPETVGEENLSRLPYATNDDIGQSKVTLAARHLERTAPDVEVHALGRALQSREALHALKGVDVLVGCVDNDGARLILNEIALAYRIPYFDVGVGIHVGPSGVEEIGATLAVVLPGGPCLNCMGLIDPIEARYFVTSPESREVERTWGYVDGLEAPAPAVCSLNAAAAAMLVNEFALFASGGRRPSPMTQLDVLGRAYELHSQRAFPIRVSADPGCFECQKALTADDSSVDRYVWEEPDQTPSKRLHSLWQSVRRRLRP
jgi:molybdopterin/thiamine biosynthesis adenylyltransferase